MEAPIARGGGAAQGQDEKGEQDERRFHGGGSCVSGESGIDNHTMLCKV
jgi:hypothetical protein